LPQKLCLTFRAPLQNRQTERVTSRGYYHHVAAREFAGMLSLITRRRVFVTGVTREEGLPIEQSADVYQHLPMGERQRLKEIQAAEIYSLLAKLCGMQRPLAETFLQAV
jgi:hypothetical protein